MSKLPIILAILLYILIYFLRTQQAPTYVGVKWDEIEVFKEQRQALGERISQILPSPQAELLSGILLGQNKGLPGKLKLSLRDTSTLHIVVASGQNLSILAGFFLSLSGLIRRRTAILLTLVAVILYTVLTGVQVPILRAAVMFGFASAAQFFGRQAQSTRILITTALMMLLINPAWLFELSFQLSFLATFGVVVVAPIFLKYFKALPLLGQDLAVTLGAQALVIPIIAQNFHQISLVGVLTNLLVGWTVPFIMVIGALSLVFGFISPIILAFLNYFIYIVEFFSSLPFAWEYIGEQSGVVWLGYYILLWGIMLLLKNAKTNSS